MLRDPDLAEPAAISAMADLDGKRIVEVGCGIGRLTGFAAQHASGVYAFDPDPERVAQNEASLARELRDRVRFATHGAEALDVERERFDLALCGWSL